MEPSSAIAILDVGKTNKKFLVFDPDYRIVLEESVKLTEATDEDGFPCEDLNELNAWLRNCKLKIRNIPNYSIKAMNFSAYGASLVHLSREGGTWGPLYNYLKPFPSEYRENFQRKYGSWTKLSLEMASPELGSLNSGMQLFRIASSIPSYKRTTSFALHLPQYLSWFFSGRPVSEITSVGCHTMMWDFTSDAYHPWLEEEGLLYHLAPMHAANCPVTSGSDKTDFLYGSGLHDSSAALVPYLKMGGEKFVVLSTGTWSISLNPFNREPLTIEELSQDCLMYLTPGGERVKASRFFSGPEHEQLISKIKDHFHTTPETHHLRFRKEWFHSMAQPHELSQYSSAEEAYQRLMWEFIIRQKRSTDLCIGQTDVKRICVDGGFSQNHIYMQLLAQAYPHLDVYAAAVPQASAIGAAMILEGVWNPEPPAIGVVELRFIPRLNLN